MKYKTKKKSKTFWEKKQNVSLTTKKHKKVFNFN